MLSGVVNMRYLAFTIRDIGDLFNRNHNYGIRRNSHYSQTLNP